MKQTFTYWVYAKLRYDGTVQYELSDIQWTGEHLKSRSLNGEYTVTHDLPDVSTHIPDIIGALRNEKAMMQAAANAAIAEVGNKIQNLLAIGHEVTA